MSDLDVKTLLLSTLSTSKLWCHWRLRALMFFAVECIGVSYPALRKPNKEGRKKAIMWKVAGARRCPRQHQDMASTSSMLCIIALILCDMLTQKGEIGDPGKLKSISPDRLIGRRGPCWFFGAKREAFLVVVNSWWRNEHMFLWYNLLPN